VTHDPGHRSHGHSVADLRRTGDPAQRRHEAFFADLDVVGDLDQVVDLRPRADARDAGRGPVHRGVGLQFHIVPDLHRSDLRDLLVPAFVESESVSVSADHDAGLEDAPVPDLAVLPHGDAGIEEALGTDLGVSADIAVGVEDGIVPDDGVLLHHHVGAQDHVLSDPGARAHHGRRMGRRRVLQLLTSEKFQQAGPTPRGVLEDHGRPAVGVHPRGDQERGGFGRVDIGGVFRVTQERHVLVRGLGQSGHSFDGQPRRPLELAVHERRDFAEGDLHGNEVYGFSCSGGGSPRIRRRSFSVRSMAVSP